MKLLVLDTETLGLYDQRIYDLGYVIYDTETESVVCERNYIIKQIFDNLELMQTAYYNNKRPIYEKRLADGYCKRVYWGVALRILEKDLKRYEPDGIWAYNSKFDHRAFEKTCTDLNSKINPVADGIADIMQVIGDITETEDYQEFCRKNGFLTKHKKPRPQRKAETLYRYLNNQTDYIEEHTALADSRIELEILLVALGLIA